MLVAPVKSVIFDLDRTLWDFDKNSREVLYELFLPIAESQKVQVSEMVHVYEHYNFLFWAQYQKDIIQREALRVFRFSALLAHYGANQHFSAEELSEEYVNRCPQKTGLVDGCLPLLNYLKDKYELHVITNGHGPVQHVKLENSALRPYFQFVVSPDSVGCKKPCKKIFHYTLGRAKIKHPHEALYIGDEFSTDFIGATEAGLQSIHFDAHQTLQTPNRVGHLGELMNIL